MSAARQLAGKLAYLVAAKMRRHGLTQLDVANETGLTGATVSRVLAGKVSPSLETAAALAAWVGCDLALAPKAAP